MHPETPRKPLTDLSMATKSRDLAGTWCMQTMQSMT